MTARRRGVSISYRRSRSGLSPDMGLTPAGFIGNMVDEKIADNRFGNRRELRKRESKKTSHDFYWGTQQAFP